TTSLLNSGIPFSALNTALRPPGLKVPVVCVEAPVSWMDIGTLNMSTIVVLQYIPLPLKVNSTQSCSTWKLGSPDTQPAGYCKAGRPLPSVTTLNFSLSFREKYTRPDMFGRLTLVPNGMDRSA